MSWKENAVRAVMKLGEQSTFDAINANTDGAGLSWGAFQWTEASGELAKVLNRAATSFPAEMPKVFGPSWRDLLTHLRERPMEPLEGAKLWQSPWVERFRAAGRQGWMQAVQVNHAIAGYHFEQALEAAEILEVTTDRGFAMVLDRAVVAPGRVTTSARKAMEQGGEDEPDEMLRVAQFAGLELAAMSSRWRDNHKARVNRYIDSKDFTDTPVLSAAA